MAQFGPNMALFWTNMALNVPGNSHEVKVGLISMKYIQADHLDPVLSLSGPYSGHRFRVLEVLLSPNLDQNCPC